MSRIVSDNEHKVNIEVFKQNYYDIILNFDPVMYDDEYMVILAGKTHSITLDHNTVSPIITYQMADRKILNSFETTMVNNFSEYNTLLILSKKILVDFIIDARKYELYDYKNKPLYDIYYLKNKYFKNKKLSIVVDTLDNFEKINKKILADMDINIELNTTPSNFKIYDNSFIYFFRPWYGIYNYTDYIKYFVNTYNDLIKIEPNDDNTYGIFIKTEYYIELIMDMIDILRYYYNKVILVRTKFNSRYNFMLILENKLQKYDPKHKVEFKKKLYRLQNTPLNPIYVDFMNKLYKNYAEKVKTIVSINKLDNTQRSLIEQRFKFYQDYYHINFVKKISQ